MSKKSKYYVVWKGVNPGIYRQFSRTHGSQNRLSKMQKAKIS